MLINQISVKNFSKRLSTRLLALTALWVTFIVMTIGYTMALSWRIEDAARTQSIVGQMPGQIYRMVILVDERYPQVNFEAEMRAFDMSLGIFDIAAAQEFLSTTEAERAALSRFRAAWNESVKTHCASMKARSHCVTRGYILSFKGASGFRIPMACGIISNAVSPNSCSKSCLKSFVPGLRSRR